MKPANEPFAHALQLWFDILNVTAAQVAEAYRRVDVSGDQELDTKRIGEWRTGVSLPQRRAKAMALESALKNLAVDRGILPPPVSLPDAWDFCRGRRESTPDLPAPEQPRALAEAMALTIQFKSRQFLEVLQTTTIRALQDGVSEWTRTFRHPGGSLQDGNLLRTYPVENCAVSERWLRNGMVATSLFFMTRPPPLMSDSDSLLKRFEHDAVVLRAGERFTFRASTLIEFGVLPKGGFHEFEPRYKECKLQVEVFFRANDLPQAVWTFAGRPPTRALRASSSALSILTPDGDGRVAVAFDQEADYQARGIAWQWSQAM